MSDRAVIEASLEGADKVAKDAGKVDKALKNTKDSAEKAGKEGKNAAGGWKELTKGVDETVKGLSATKLLGASVGGAILAAGHAVYTYFKEGAAAAEDFQGKTSRVSRRASIDLATLRDVVEENETANNESADSSTEFVEALTRLTYDGRSAAETVKSMSQEARATGRSLQELTARAAALRTGLGLVGDQEAELGRIRDMAESLGTVGGPEAFKDLITALAPQLSQVAIKSDEARAEVEAFLGVLTKGLKPEAAQRTGAAALSGLKAKKNVIQALTGVDVVDENNEIIPGNIVPAFQAVKKRVQRSTKDPRVQKRILENFFGEDVAAALQRGDLEDVKKVAARSKDRGKTNEEARTYVETTEGERERLKLKAEQRKRRAGGEVLPIGDRLDRASDRFMETLGAGVKDVGSHFDSGASAEEPLGGSEATALLKQLVKTTEGSRFTAADLEKSMQKVTLKATVSPDPNAPVGN